MVVTRRKAARKCRAEAGTEFGFQKNDDAVEGVILMLRGEQTQNVLKGVEAKTEELNRQILPPDVKIHPYYDRSELVDLTTDTVEAKANLLVVLAVPHPFPLSHDWGTLAGGLGCSPLDDGP